jgi:hypothetical protein
VLQLKNDIKPQGFATLSGSRATFIFAYQFVGCKVVNEKIFDLYLNNFLYGECLTK